jgi:hypothetical protein
VRIISIVEYSMLAYRRAIVRHGVSNEAAHLKRRFDLLDYARKQHTQWPRRVNALVKLYTEADAAMLAPEDVVTIRDSDIPPYAWAFSIEAWAARLEAAYDAKQIWCDVCDAYGAAELHEVEDCLECGKGYHLELGGIRGLCAECDQKQMEAL